MELLYRERAYPFRSRGLFIFLRVLQGAYPDWVDMAGIEIRLPGIKPRQLARFIDLLEAPGLPLVAFETKTRGRYRLAVEPGEIAFEGASGFSLPAEELPPQPLLPFSAATGAALLDTLTSESWIEWVLALMHAHMTLQGGQISGEGGTLRYLDRAEAVAQSLPPWTLSVIQVRRAQALARESRYREAAFCLRQVETLARNGTAHPAALSRARLVKAKIRYDQERFTEVAQLLGAATAEIAVPCSHALNLRALLLGREFMAAGEGEAPRLLAQTLSMLAEALGNVFLGYGDSSMLDALTFNFGNNLLRGVKKGVLPEFCAETVMEWLAANMLVNRKLGIGDDSVLTYLLLVDVGLDHGYHPLHWPLILRQGLKLPGTLDGLLELALAEARQIGNRLEIAQCLLRKVRLAINAQAARDAYFEARSLFLDLGRKKNARQMADEWRALFGVPPDSARSL